MKSQPLVLTLEFRVLFSSSYVRHLERFIKLLGGRSESKAAIPRCWRRCRVMMSWVPLCYFRRTSKLRHFSLQSSH